jgi:hypothetical protein
MMEQHTTKEQNRYLHDNRTVILEQMWKATMLAPMYHQQDNGLPRWCLNVSATLLPGGIDSSLKVKSK